MARFKIGDIVTVGLRSDSSICDSFSGNAEIMFETSDNFELKRDDGMTGGGRRLEGFGNLWNYSKSGEKYLTKVTNKINMKDILNKAALMFKGEPQKSFIKAGIMSQDEIPTDDGVKLLVSYLLKDATIGAGFKATVVDPLLAEIEKESK